MYLFGALIGFLRCKNSSVVRLAVELKHGYQYSCGCNFFKTFSLLIDLQKVLVRFSVNLSKKFHMINKLSGIDHWFISVRVNPIVPYDFRNSSWYFPIEKLPKLENFERKRF